MTKFSRYLHILLIIVLCVSFVTLIISGFTLIKPWQEFYGDFFLSSSLMLFVASLIGLPIVQGHRLKWTTWSFIVLAIGTFLWINSILSIWYGHAFFLNASALCLLPSFAFVILMSIVFVMVNWKRWKWFGFIPLFIGIFCIFSWFFFGPARYIENLRFEQNFLAYNQIVEQIQSGQITLPMETSEPVEISRPKDFPAFAIYAKKFNNSEIIVEFLTATYRTRVGYLYISQDKVIKDIHRIKTLWKIKSNWYFYSW